MINTHLKFSASALLAIAVLVCGAQRADAFNMTTYVSTISQAGYTAGVNLGHAVSATSDMNRLYAGGAFEARCASAYTGSISDQRGFSGESLIGGTRLTVTVPQTMPAMRPMPGFDQMPGGTTLTCTYNWTADAEESTFTLGVPGFGITIGGRKAHDGSSVPFLMFKPGGGGTDDNGCIR